MKTLYVGWDVGAWHCDQNPASQDAICVLEQTDTGELNVVYELLWRGNLRERLVAGCSERTVLVPNRGNQPFRLVVAIDTPLGWSLGFSRLIAGLANGAEVGPERSENPYLFRECERVLFGAGFSPMSTVEVAIGSQSTKGMHFLQRCGFRLVEPGVWGKDRAHAIEAYPGPIWRNDCALRRRLEGLYDQAAFDAVVGEDDGARRDGRDALLCALVAAEFGMNRAALQAPPQSLFDRVVKEGWIWLPAQLFELHPVAAGE